jgi:hypothetical protein
VPTGGCHDRDSAGITDPVTDSDVGMVCVVDGCSGDASGPPIVFGGVQALLCRDHRRQFDTDPMSWDGELDATRNRVVRLWRREGIGSAS